MTVVKVALVAELAVLAAWLLTTGPRVLAAIRELRTAGEPMFTDAELYAWLEATPPIKETESSAP